MTLSEIFAFHGTKKTWQANLLPPPEITVSGAEKHFSFSKSEKTKTSVNHCSVWLSQQLHNKQPGWHTHAHTHSFAAKSVCAALLHCWHADPANHMDLIRVLRMAAFNLEIGGRECGRLKSREKRDKNWEREKMQSGSKMSPVYLCLFPCVSVCVRCRQRSVLSTN